MKRVWLLSCALIVLCSCARHPHQVFRQAESMMNTQADSARILLERLPQDQLRDYAAKARYGLLLTMAKDKSYQDDLDTALIQASYDYYQHWGTKKQRMLSAYYLGVARQHQEQDLEAALLFRESEFLADKMDNCHYAGLSCEHLSALYARNYDNEESIAAAKRAVLYFQKAGETLSADFSRLDIARRLFAMRQYNCTQIIADSLLACQSIGYPDFLYSVYLLKAETFFNEGMYDDAEAYFKLIEAGGYSMDIVGSRKKAIIWASKGFYPKADSLLQEMKGHMQTSVDSASVLDTRRAISFLRGDMQQAYKSLEDFSHLQDREIRLQLARSITHAQKNYYEQHYNLERKNKQLLLLSGVSIILALTLILLIIFTALLRRKKQVILEMAKVNQLTEDIEKLNLARKGNDAVIATLLQDKIKTMQALSATYFNWSDDAFAKQEEHQGAFTKDEILSSFRKHLRKLRSDENFLISLERAMDMSSQNLIHRLRNQFSGPAMGNKLKEPDIQYLVLFFAGFSSKSISFLMDSTEDAVRARKSRYRKFFKDAGEAGEEYWNRLK